MRRSVPTIDRHVAWTPLLAVAASATIFTTTQGLTYPLLALRLDHMAVSTWFIGINAAMTPAGMIVAAAAVPSLIPRVGSYALMMTSLLGAMLALLAIGANSPPLLWFPLRFAIGVFLATIFVATDTWVNQLASEASRGRILGFYSALLSIGFAAGPAALAVLGPFGRSAFIACAACPLVASLPLFLVRHQLPPSPYGPAVSLRAFARSAPLLLLCVIAVALTEQGAMSLLPIYALRQRMSLTESSLTLVVMIAGSIMLQYPIGSLADRLARPLATAMCAAAAALAAALLPWGVQIPGLFWVLIFVWGGAYYGIYTLSLVRLGECYSGGLLVAGSAAFGAMWGIGGVIGPPLIGGAMNILGPAGLPLAIAAVYAAIAVGVGISGRGHGTRKSGRR
jgi:MFS family permease